MVTRSVSEEEAATEFALAYASGYHKTPTSPRKPFVQNGTGTEIPARCTQSNATYSVKVNISDKFKALMMLPEHSPSTSM